MTDAMAALPLLVLAGGALATLLALIVFARPAAAFVVACVALAAALASVPVAWLSAPRGVTPLLVMDRYALFAIGLVVAAALLVALLSWPRARERADHHGEYYFLLLVATLGACVLAAASVFATAFLGLELLSVSLYSLIAYDRSRPRATEAGITYLVLAGVASAFVFFGMALMYAETGTMELPRILAVAGGAQGPIFAVGLALALVGLGFKLAVVPFHLWTPDIYDGAAPAVAGFVATASKGAVAALLMRLLGPAVAVPGSALSWAFGAVAALTMFAGNLLALREDNVKRILAYSSIANVGYLLLAFLASGPGAVRALFVYLPAYFAASLGAFAVVEALSTRDAEADSLERYRGMARSHPALAAALVIFLLSLAGLPFTAGFVGKLVVIEAGVGAGTWVLAVILAVNSVIGVFYYLRIVSTVFGGGPGGPARALRPGWPVSVPIAFLALAVLVLGVYPTPLLRLIELVTGG